MEMEIQMVTPAALQLLDGKMAEMSEMAKSNRTESN